MICLHVPFPFENHFSRNLKDISIASLYTLHLQHLFTILYIIYLELL